MGTCCVYLPLITKFGLDGFRRQPSYFHSHVFHAAKIIRVRSHCTRIPTCRISEIKQTEKNTSHNLTLQDKLNAEQKGQVSLFVDTLLEWSQRMNLTAVGERCAMMERHVEDSLALLPVIEDAYGKHCSATESENLKVVDVGSGAGLPGVILAIARPDWQVTLIESLQKRCCFLEHVVEVSGLSNIQVVHMRAEDAGQNADFREMYDVSVARAVAEMRVLAEYCLPLIRVGGLLVAAKGYNPKEEVENAKKAIDLMGASMLQLCSGNQGTIHDQQFCWQSIRKNK
uniref:Ribosomal RNA small subunit methyltransferase G n=1 Tax=Araucaria cunninghamii TaxID=56994 RepID=A0A0D6R7T4_ARACU